MIKIIMMNDDDYNDLDDDYDAIDADMVEFSPLVRSQSRRGFFLSPPTCHKTNQDKCQIFIMMTMMINLQAAIHCVYCDSDSQRSHRSDIPSAEGTESFIPYLKRRRNS